MGAIVSSADVETKSDNRYEGIKEIELKVRSGARLIVVNTIEEIRFCEDIIRYMGEYTDIYTWTPVSQFRKITSVQGILSDSKTDRCEPVETVPDPITGTVECGIINWVVGNKQRNKPLMLLLLRHMAIGHDEGSTTALKLKESMQLMPNASAIVVIGESVDVHPTLSRDYIHVDYRLRDRDAIEDDLKDQLQTISYMIDANKDKLVWVNGDTMPMNKAYKLPSDPDIPHVVDAMTGLTASEGKLFMEESLRKLGKIDPIRISSAKRNIVNKSGLLEWYEPVNMSEVGGLDNIKKFVDKRKVAFGNKDAEEYGLPTPKGIVILGISGTGN